MPNAGHFSLLRECVAVDALTSTKIHPPHPVPFFFIVPLWLILVVLSIPLFAVPRLRFLGTHVVMASTVAVLISFALSTLILFGVPRLIPPFRWSGVVLIVLYVLAIVGGGGAGLLLGILLAHNLNKRFGWWPVPPAAM